MVTKSAKETKDFGKQFANRLKGGEILALVGGLGSGKTTFTQGLAEGLGLTAEVLSPTFILMRQYETNNKNLYHIDLYRLEDNINHELLNLGFKDFAGDSKNIVVVEWADKAQDFFPANTIWINFEGSADQERKISIK